MLAVTIKVYTAALAAKWRRWTGAETDPYLPLPPGTVLSPSRGVAAAFAQARPALGFAGADDPGEWQRRAREKLSEIAGYSRGAAVPAVSHAGPAEFVADGIVKRSFYLRIRPDADLPVHLIHAVDLAGSAPVFMHLAGSTSGVHLAWGAARVPIDHQRLAIGADMALQAARWGYLGVAIEQAGFGERGERDLPKRSADRTIDLANHLLLLGRSLMGDGAADVSAALDWVLSGAVPFSYPSSSSSAPQRPVTADPARIFLFGHSAGGTLAQFAAALDTRISGVLASGSVGPVRTTIGARGAGGGDGIVPGFLNWFDTQDLIALCAPRPFVALNGTRDHIFPAASAAEVVAGAREFYDRVNAGAHIQAVPVDGPHQYHAAESWVAWDRFIDPAPAQRRAKFPID